jgi:hypothetical protein
MMSRKRRRSRRRRRKLRKMSAFLRLFSIQVLRLNGQNQILAYKNLSKDAKAI